MDDDKYLGEELNDEDSLAGSKLIDDDDAGEEDADAEILGVVIEEDLEAEPGGDNPLKEDDENDKEGWGMD